MTIILSQQEFSSPWWHLELTASDGSASSVDWILNLDLVAIIQGELTHYHTSSGMFGLPPLTWKSASIMDDYTGLTIDLMATDNSRFVFATSPLGEYAVPEPTAALIFGLALAMIGRRLRR